MLGALAYSDKTAKLIMTPKSVVFMLRSDQPVTLEVILKIKESGFTRIPIFDKQSKDNVIGVLFVKDLLGIDLSQNHVINDFLREDLLLVKEDIRLDNLLNHFIKVKKHLAAVFNEFGVFQGVVSLEDIIEEILKIEIVDEADQTKDLQSLAKSMIYKKLLGE